MAALITGCANHSAVGYKDEQGRGTKIYPDGSKYVGEWKDSMRHGKGTHTFLVGIKYEGDWKHDKRDGQGTLTIPVISGERGSTYVGEWKENTIDGFGAWTWTSGESYEGMNKGSRKHGHGKYTSVSESGEKIIWEGEFRNNKKNGKGVFIYENGNRGEGEWKDGKLHGTTNMIWANGKETRMEYRDGEPYADEDMRSDCVKEAGEANTEYAAKKIEKMCLAKMGLEP